MIQIHDDLKALATIRETYKLKNSAAIQVGDLVFIGGLAAIDMDTGKPVDGDIHKQSAVVLHSLERVLSEIGLSLDHVVKVNATLTNGDVDFPGWNETFQETFDAPYPVRTTVGGQAAVGLIEVEMIAALEPRR
jgi:2-iminobutanoate/2-iminopropanoate deaminase